MTNAIRLIESEYEQKRRNIQLITNGTFCDKQLAEKEIKYNKDGSVKKTHCNKMTGQSSEVYAFRTKEEINAMINVLNKHIESALNNNQRQITARNKMLFLVGINLGIRASDLHDLQWSFFYDIANGKTFRGKPPDSPIKLWSKVRTTKPLWASSLP